MEAIEIMKQWKPSHCLNGSHSLNSFERPIMRNTNHEFILAYENKMMRESFRYGTMVTEHDESLINVTDNDCQKCIQAMRMKEKRWNPLTRITIYRLSLAEYHCIEKRHISGTTFIHYQYVFLKIIVWKMQSGLGNSTTPRLKKLSPSKSAITISPDLPRNHYCPYGKNFQQNTSCMGKLIRKRSLMEVENGFSVWREE